MGTNYYLITEKCPHCGNEKKIHLGKNSNKCKFLFRKYENIQNFEDFKAVIKTGYIIDEYNNICSAETLLNIIEKAQINKNKANSNSIMIDGYSFLNCDFR